MRERERTRESFYSKRSKLEKKREGDSKREREAKEIKEQEKVKVFLQYFPPPQEGEKKDSLSLSLYLSLSLRYLSILRSTFSTDDDDNGKRESWKRCADICSKIISHHLRGPTKSVIITNLFDNFRSIFSDTSETKISIQRWNVCKEGCG